MIVSQLLTQDISQFLMKNYLYDSSKKIKGYQYILFLLLLLNLAKFTKNLAIPNLKTNLLIFADS
ncbi:hypothetical protein FVIR_GE00222 [Candidatus Gullanella endobia]|uniref:Uncharacterized protein n=1 Tax=Candidatus Gullanella endobia TaxID=1070130 RepID=A0A143WQW5_9ENTR|nr:hypothetical protein FVIR_GE00222 [Candidatus Gullanella endobia]